MNTLHLNCLVYLLVTLCFHTVKVKKISFVSFFLLNKNQQRFILLVVPYIYSEIFSSEISLCAYARTKLKKANILFANELVGFFQNFICLN